MRYRFIVITLLILVALPWRLEAGERITVGGYTFEAALDSMTIYDSAWQFVRYDPILTWRLVEPEPEVINKHRVYVYPITGSRSPDTSCHQVWFQKNIIKEKIERLYKLYDELTKPPAEPKSDSMKYQGGDGDLTVKDIADLVWAGADTGRVIEVIDTLTDPYLIDFEGPRMAYRYCPARSTCFPELDIWMAKTAMYCPHSPCCNTVTQGGTCRTTGRPISVKYEDCETLKWLSKKYFRLTNCQYDIDTTYSYDHNVRTGENSNFRYSLDTVAVYCDTTGMGGE